MRKNVSPEFLDLLAAKFIVNLPQEELNEDRIAFHFERAYFYYVDTLDTNAKSSQANSKIIDRSKEIISFCSELLRIVSCPQLPKMTGNSIAQQIEEAYNTVPVNGIILLNMQETHALLVQSQNNNVFGFPKGKIHEGETSESCASREVREEIGLKVDIDPNLFVQVEMTIKLNNKNLTKQCKFFIHKIEESCVVPRKCQNFGITKESGVRQIIHSANEIQSIGWFKIADEIPKLIEQNLLNKVSRLAFLELKKVNKNAGYKEKKLGNPLIEFKGFDKSLGNIFLK